MSISIPDSVIDSSRLDALLEREQQRFAARHPRSAELYARGREVYLYGTPLHWMQLWPGAHPVYMRDAQGAHLRDVDGNEFVDLCLGDTGSMFGHSHPAIADAIARQAHRGVTAMLPSEDGVWVGEELSRRFGLPYWQLATSASDANRFALRLARLVTGRDKILVFNGNYHGSVDETQVEFDAQGRMRTRTNVTANGMDHERLVRLVEFNDIEALERELSHGDVACVITEPMMTNIGMVPVAPGYHAALREITRRYGTLLLIDETHTISTGPGGCTRAWGLEPDIFVLGKAIAGGIPSAVYGVTEAVAQRVWAAKPPAWAGGEKRNNHSGFGGTLVGNQLTIAGLRATLEHVMTDENYAHMIEMATRIARSVDADIAKHALPWHLTQVGARAEYMFMPQPPRNGSEAKAGRNGPLEAFIHLYLLNRGVLITPFHNMMLACPQLAPGDVDQHNRAFSECLAELVGG
ncbi:aspartate aminotransferase family protein [Paraburkholderia pallida]|uniref:Aspartate aminotransferase family protein n=1 Tax=Paraburkholderia pallida TaxID=2547399 RepID=A0A4P7CXW4_9BURK|nr:aspartate aminotransferase family protein [Paraburkholderia pallida]QBQ98863.1 aspartate aminotransferase family protein [Paraburkholderia pallida]